MLWEVDASGHCQAIASNDPALRRWRSRRPYRLYHLLSDLDDLVASTSNDRQRVRIAAHLVSRFIQQAQWLVDTCPMPDPKLGWGIHSLYSEPDYPFTVQIVSWLPGFPSPVHNHATWSIVAVLGDREWSGHEINTLWQRQGDRGVTAVAEQIVYPGDVIGFVPEAIHSVSQRYAPNADLPTLTLTIYGETDYSQRFEFEPEAGLCKLF